MWFPEKLTSWSKIESASRRPPSLFWATMFRALSSMFTFSCEATYFRWFTVSVIEIRLKSQIWHRERIVGIILCFSVVANMKMACAGALPVFFRNALKAPCSVCVPRRWCIRCSVRFAVECAPGRSVSGYHPTVVGGCIQLVYVVRPLFVERFAGFALVAGFVIFRQVFAVDCFGKNSGAGGFPTPRGPQKRYAWASLLLLIAFFSVVVSESWPTTERKVEGRYLRAETTYESICSYFSGG